MEWCQQFSSLTKNSLALWYGNGSSRTKLAVTQLAKNRQWFNTIMSFGKCLTTTSTFIKNNKSVNALFNTSIEILWIGTFCQATISTFLGP